MTTPLKIIALIAASIGAILGITTAVGLWTVRDWLAPLAPVLYLASALLVVFLVLGAAWFVVTRRELALGIGTEGVSVEERALQRLVILTAEVLLGVFALGVAGLWNLDSVRAEFVDSRHSNRELEAVLADPSPLVRLAACQELFKRGWVYRSKNQLIASLNGEPAVAAKCLQTAQENAWKGVDQIALELNDGWTAEIMRSGDLNAANACELTPWSPVMSELSNQPAEPRLLHCATGAASDTVRQCCADTLVSRGKLLDMLGDPAIFPTEAATLVFAELVRHGFQPLTLTSTQQNVARALGTDDEKVRRWVVHLGCDLIDPTSAQPEILGGMIELVQADTCGLTAGEESEYASPAAWTRLCDQIVEDKTDRPIQVVVCEGVQLARIAKAADAAQIAVHAAIRATFLEKDADFLVEGLAEASRRGEGGIPGEKSNLEKLLDMKFANAKGSGGGGGAGGEKTPAQTYQCQKIVVDEQIKATGADPREYTKVVWSDSCTEDQMDRGFDPDMTGRKMMADRNDLFGKLQKGENAIAAGATAEQKKSAGYSRANSEGQAALERSKK